MECVYRSIALRKVKTLGPQRNFAIIRPGQYMPPLPGRLLDASSNGGESDADDEGLPTSVSNLPAFEPLVLWTDPMDPSNKVEVSV